MDMLRKLTTLLARHIQSVSLERRVKQEMVLGRGEGKKSSVSLVDWKYSAGNLCLRTDKSRWYGRFYILTLIDCADAFTNNCLIRANLRMKKH
ncbi:hypothetical protein T4D_15882 [Trichinella pseudospiralis]|uniref:Uncharacterized protein n=1 Tax=Trichinella pseudospiralis TaxID=6337 RepID=A0A0V1FTE6_TRIPS|nr:hypothetical protein T4D_15882 [Trichinella pseudospiralis]